MLTKENHIMSVMQKATATITGAVIGDAQTIDNERISQVGLILTRKIRRLIIQNLDNVVHEVQFATSDSAVAGTEQVGGNEVDVGQRIMVSNFGVTILEPEKISESILQAVGLGNVRRFCAYVPVGAVVSGVEIVADYYDDRTG